MRISRKVLLVIVMAIAAALVLQGSCRSKVKRTHLDSERVTRDPSEFLWSDAWLLTSIFWAQRAEREASLMKVIAYGDAINHAVFLPEELESGLVRLTEAHLIEETDGVFRPVHAAQGWYDEFVALNLDNIASMKWTESKLHSDGYRDGHDPRNNRRYPGFTRAKYDDAIRSYKSWFAEQLARSSTGE